jgi:hypothetical protein
MILLLENQSIFAIFSYSKIQNSMIQEKNLFGAHSYSHLILFCSSLFSGFDGCFDFLFSHLLFVLVFLPDFFLGVLSLNHELFSLVELSLFVKVRLIEFDF